MRRAAKVDATHSDIVQAFRQCGAWVADTAKLGSGFPDVLIAYAGRYALVEIKTPKTRKRFTAKQRDFQAACPGPYGVACSVDDVPMILHQLRHGVLGPMREEER